MVHGVQCATTSGTSVMLRWCARSWATLVPFRPTPELGLDRAQVSGRSHLKIVLDTFLVISMGNS